MKQLLVLLLLLYSANVSAQDVIVKKDGSTILSKVLEVGLSEIKYKKHDHLDGPTYTISKSELQAINYQNGTKDTFSEPVRKKNKNLPKKQNDGTQQDHDKALLRIDANKHSKKYIYWNIKAGLSFDTYTGSSEEFSFTPGYDVSFGTVFPLKKTRLVFGIDASLFSYGTHMKNIDEKINNMANGTTPNIGYMKKKDENINNLAIGITQYIGYKVLISESFSLRPYIGPYVSFVPRLKSIDCSEKDYQTKQDKRSYIFSITDGGMFGLNLGLEAFLSKNIYIDLHCRKDIKSNVRETTRERNTNRDVLVAQKERNDLTALKIVLGIGFQL